MAQVTITERIYLDDKGRRVAEDAKGAKTLAAVPGDQISEERAVALGVKEKEKEQDKSRKREPETK